MTPPKAVTHLTSEELATRLKLADASILAEWRKEGRGPAYLKDGAKFVRYRLADVEAWEQAHLSSTT